MTDAEIVKLLAERDDYGKGSGSNGIPHYLSDRNALARVIGKMTEEEFYGVWNEIVIWAAKNNVVITGHWLLTCDPRVIAECVAKAIHAAKGGG